MHVSLCLPILPSGGQPLASAHAWGTCVKTFILRVNFLLWWQASSGHLCFLCRPSGCVSISDPRLRESSWGSEPVHLPVWSQRPAAPGRSCCMSGAMPVGLFLLHPNRG